MDKSPLVKKAETMPVLLNTKPLGCCEHECLLQPPAELQGLISFHPNLSVCTNPDRAGSVY